MHTSVIVPTYNRAEFLHDLLESLAHQSLSMKDFDVIIVDDGSTDSTSYVVKQSFPLNLRYVRQDNQGDAAARNRGVEISQADLLVFLDDDMLVKPTYLAYLIDSLVTSKNNIVIGTEYLLASDTDGLPYELQCKDIFDHSPALVECPFVNVFSRNMAIRREAYISIGGMSNLGFAGSSMWCDTEFAYRAYQLGFRFYRSNAVCFHRDYVAMSLEYSKRRSREAARRAVVLLQRYPELLSFLPMLHDKTSIDWQCDGPGLIMRKSLRRAASTTPMLWSLEQLASRLEQHRRLPNLLAKLHTWICGSYMYCGLREGIRQYGPLSTK